MAVYLTQYQSRKNTGLLLNRKFAISEAPLLIRTDSRKARKNWVGASRVRVLVNGKTITNSAFLLLGDNYFFPLLPSELTPTYYQLYLSPVSWLTDLRVRFYKL